MPYIKQKNRKKFDKALAVLPKIENCGELNYLFTSICLIYLRQSDTSYQKLNDCEGALSCASKELYRRIAVPYEEIKIAENGEL